MSLKHALTLAPCYLALTLMTSGCSRQPAGPDQPSPLAPAEQQNQTPAIAASIGNPETHVYRRVMLVSIGIDKYRSAGVPELTCGVADAKAIAEQARHHYGYEPVLLLGPQATKQAVEATLSGCGEKLGERDALLIFFAGHGQVIDLPSFGRAGYLIPYDADLDLKDRSDHVKWSKEALDMRQLVERVEKMKAQHVVLIVDSCCSGFMTKRGNLEGRPDLQVLLKQPSRAVLAAATEQQEAREDPGKGHGFFTGALLDQLKEYSDRQDAASVTDVFLQARIRLGKVPNRILERMTPQLAHVGDGDGEFVFIPRTISTQEVKAFLDGNAPAGGHALARVQDRALKRTAQKTTLKDVIEAFEAMDYRYSTRAEDQARVWEAKLKRFLDNASLGDPLAMAGLHYCFSKGLGTEKNLTEAYRWSRLAHDTGHLAGKHVLGRSYSEGYGVRPNKVAGERLIQEAADGGFALSCFWLAASILTRNPTLDQARKAHKLLEYSSDADIPNACWYLGQRYGAGNTPGIPRDISKATELLQKAADRGSPQAQWTLYVINSDTKPGYPPKNLTKAGEFLMAAARTGFHAAQTDLAIEYYRMHTFATCLELQRDFDEAHKWAELAAAQGDSLAHFLLWNMYSLGHGVPRDMDIAVKHLEKAAAANRARAIKTQAMLYFNGTYYKKDEEKARLLFDRAGELGDAESWLHAGRLYKDEALRAKLKSEFSDGFFIQATIRFMKAAQMGNKEAQVELQGYLGPPYIREKALEEIEQEKKLLKP